MSLSFPYTSPVASAVLSGLALACSYLLGGIPGFVAYMPLLYMMASHEPMKRWTYVWVLYITFFLYHGLTNWWIASWQEHTDPYLFASGIALMLAHPIFLSLPFYVLASLRRRVGPYWMLLAAPLCITGFEWLHGQTDASYPWLTSGYMLTNSAWGQLAEFVGVYGLTLLLTTVNASLAWWQYTRKQNTRSTTIPFVVGGVVAVLGVVGLIRKAEFKSEGSHGGIDVVVVQPNLDPWDKWGGTWDNVLLHERIVDSVTALHPDLKHSLVVWPETAIPYAIRRSMYADDWDKLRGWVDTSCATLLTGYADYYVYPPSAAPASARRSRVDSTLRYDVFNAAMVVPSRVASNQTQIPTHHKSRLTPFAERLPFADQLTFAMSWIEWGVGISAWGKGQTCTPLKVNDTVKVGPIICIESIYPEVASEFVRQGANVLCVITNDAWYNGTWGPQQHFDIAVMRAIEQRKPLIRCAMSGISGFILPDGTTDTTAASQLPPMQRGALMSTVLPNPYRTLYSKIGDPWSPICLLLSVSLLIATRFPVVIRNMHIRFSQSSQSKTL